MMFKSLIFTSLFTAVVLAQTVDYQLWESEDSCDGEGAVCNGLPEDVCCAEPNDNGGVDLFSSVSTDNWQNVAGGTEVKATSLQGTDACAIEVALLEEGECVISDTPLVFSGGFFNNGQAARKVRRETRKCSSTQPIDAYIMKAAGVVYSVSARNATHVAAIKAAGSSVERGQYIIAHHDSKAPAKALTKLNKLQG